MELTKEALTQLINSTADPIFVKDREHRWVLLNDACCQFIGHPREELIGKSDYDFFPKKEADMFWKKDEEVFKTGAENLNEEEFTDAKGVTYTIFTKKSLYVDPAGNGFIMGVIRDISDHRRAEKSLMQLARAQVEQEQLELFAYVASHDLREPLQSIIGFGDLLKNRHSESLDEHGRGYLKRILGAAHRMSLLIDDLLKFSKVVKRSENFTLVDVGKMITQIIEDTEYQIRKEGAVIDCGKLPILYGDETQMRQLFQNLLSNALKFHLPGRSPHITLQSRNVDEARVEISVQDNGIGMEEKYLKRIFHPFERLHNSAEFEGSGVGLAICQKIVSHHEGEIYVTSRPGEGSIFYIVLPKFHSSY